jgi:hypothetical protein
MAHYRSSLFLFTCIACLGAALGPSAKSGPHALDVFYRVLAQETAPVYSPPDDRPESKPKKPSPAPNRSKSKPSQTPKSKNSKIPKPIVNLMVILSRQRGLLMLGAAAVVITAAAVFIMLKLVGNDESNNYKRRKAKLDRHKPRNSQFTNPDSPTKFQGITQRGVAFGEGSTLPSLPYSLDFPKSHSTESGDRLLPFILEPGEAESESGLPQKDDRINPDTLGMETHSNGYGGGTGFNTSEKNPWIDSVASRSNEIALPSTSEEPKLDIIEALIEDLQHLNPAKRRKAIWELGQQGDSRAVEPLLDLLANSDSKQYSLILASLSEIGIRTLKPMNNAWSISLQNENPEVRKNAIRDLTRVYELVNEITHLLHRATDDPDPEVQETARWAINQLNRIRPRSPRDN